MDAKAHDSVSPKSLFEASGARALLDQLDAELIGLAPLAASARPTPPLHQIVRVELRTPADLRDLQLLDLEEANIQLARQNVAIALERYRLGLLTPLALREAQRNELDAETRLLDIRYAAKQAETALRRLSGGLVRE